MGSLIALYIYSTPPVQRARSHLSSFGCPIRSFWPRPKCPGPASLFLLSFLKLLKCLDQHQDHPKFCQSPFLRTTLRVQALSALVCHGVQARKGGRLSAALLVPFSSHYCCLWL